ncbi:MAG: ferritin-like domain-containing protein, partial [Rhodobacterales bacterium]
MKAKGLDVLFHETLKDIYYAERKLLKALPKMARAAQSDDLKAAFTAHKAETEEQKARLDRVFEILGKRAAGKTCPAIDGILEEGDEILEEYKDSPTLDAGLIAAAQAVENYEIARYTAEFYSLAGSVRAAQKTGEAMSGTSFEQLVELGKTSR